MEQITNYTNIPPREGYRLTLEVNKQIAQKELEKINLSEAKVDENKQLDIKA